MFLIQLEEIEYYQGKYQNALEVIKGSKDNPIEPVEIDIEYELESIKTEEINYEYILMLIQSLVPTGNDAYELIPDLNNKVSRSESLYWGFGKEQSKIDGFNEAIVG